MEAAQFRTTERGGEVICFDGMEFIERKDRRGSDGSRTWRCRDYHKNRCPETIKTMNGQVMEGKGNANHSHSGDPFLPKVREVQSLMRSHAAETMESTRSVVSNHLVDLSQDVLQRLPKRASLDDNVRAKRRASHSVNPNPQSLNFEIPDEYSEFILHDSGPDDNFRFLILGKKDLLEVLEHSELWLGDGTFDVCPSVFYQLYTIHCKVGNNYPPCVYFLLPNKRQDTYVRMLRALKDIIPDASPDKVLVDFESAAINAFAEVFDSSTLKGCLFHQGQSLNRKVAELGLKSEFQNNPDFNIAVKSLLALAFVPEGDVMLRFQELGVLFEELIESYPELDRVNELLTYVELYYIRGIERPNGRGRAPPKYPIALWNHFSDPENNIPRTTNAVEGYHNGLNSLFLAKHPTVWKLLDGLKLDAALHLKTLADARVANNPAPRHKYARINERLALKISSYPQAQDKLAYLRAVAHIFSS